LKFAVLAAVLLELERVLLKGVAPRYVPGTIVGLEFEPD
jgi:hypothetical protein